MGEGEFTRGEREESVPPNRMFPPNKDRQEVLAGTACPSVGDGRVDRRTDEGAGEWNVSEKEEF